MSTPPRIIVRRLPAQLTKDAFLEHIQEFSAHITSIKYTQGKNERPSRAYLTFATNDQILLFTKMFDNSLVLNTKIQVELAPYQPKYSPESAEQLDELNNTIEQTPEFKAFEEKFEQVNSLNLSNEQLLTFLFKKAASLQDSIDPTKTPLLEFLKNNKQELPVPKKKKKRGKKRTQQNIANFKSQSNVDSTETSSATFRSSLNLKPQVIADQTTESTASVPESKQNITRRASSGASSTISSSDQKKAFKAAPKVSSYAPFKPKASLTLTVETKSEQ